MQVFALIVFGVTLAAAAANSAHVEPTKGNFGEQTESEQQEQKMLSLLRDLGELRRANYQIAPATSPSFAVLSNVQKELIELWQSNEEAKKKEAELGKLYEESLLREASTREQLMETRQDSESLQKSVPEVEQQTLARSGEVGQTHNELE